jgi:hypothetical protein
MTRRPLRIARCLLGIAAFALLPAGARAQGPEVRVVDSTRFLQVLKTRDGSTFVGNVVAAGTDSVTFRTSVGTLTVARAAIAELREVPRTAMRAGGEYWPPDPNETRLFFAPTGRMLKRGEGYFSDTYLFLLGVAGGVTDRVTLGGGVSVLPLENFSDNILYLTPKIGLVSGERVNVAVGAAIGTARWLVEDVGTAGIFYGVGTFGGSDASVSTGVGYAYAGSDVNNTPILMLGGARRVSRRVSLVTENYLFPETETRFVYWYGLRLMGEKLSTDLAFINASSSGIFPGVPYVNVVFKF